MAVSTTGAIPLVSQQRLSMECPTVLVVTTVTRAYADSAAVYHWPTLVVLVYTDSDRGRYWLTLSAVGDKSKHTQNEYTFNLFVQFRLTANLVVVSGARFLSEMCWGRGHHDNSSIT